MNAKRLLRAAILSTLLLIVVAATALAATDGTETTKINRRNVTIQWWEFLEEPVNSISHDMCSYIPEGYVVTNDDLSNLRRKVGTVRVLPNGDQVVRVVDIVKGTATDNYGNDYNWVYRNTTTFRQHDGLVSARMTDSFRIVGGPASHSLGFKWKWQYYDDEIEIMKVYEDGELVDMYADFIWPTDDAVNETTDPNFVPGSWQIFYDFGDFANCDPI